jgi:allophanate hydrolase subunit 2
VLPVGDDAVGQPSYGQVPSRVVDVPAPDVLVDLVPGPHDDLLHGDGWQALEASTWVVGERSDRMGVRLARRTLGDGTATLGRVPGGLASFPVVTGSVQITPSSELVVLGPDAGVSGGYPVLGVARRKGLDELAQCRPGAPVRLRRATRRSPGRNRGSA